MISVTLGPSMDHLTCRLCAAPLTRSFVDLGAMPLANAYVDAADASKPDMRYPLHAKLCGSCFLVQVGDVVPPEEIFSDYAYFSSYSTSWVEHARRYAQSAKDRLSLSSDSLVVEVASNDGYLLQHFLDMGKLEGRHASIREQRGEFQPRPHLISPTYRKTLHADPRRVSLWM